MEPHAARGGAVHSDRPEPLAGEQRAWRIRPRRNRLGPERGAGHCAGALAGDHSPGAGALGCARWHASAAAAGAPKGWYLPDLARGQAELDSFDFIEDLKIARGPLLSVLTGTSLHGALPDAWILERPSAKATLEALTERWQVQGLPTYAQFDNDTIFQGAHQFADAIGRVSRLCLALKVIPVFAPRASQAFRTPLKASTPFGKARSGSGTTAPMSQAWWPSPSAI